MFEKMFWTLFTLAIVLSTSMDIRAQARGQGRPAPAGSDRADRYSPRRLRSQEKHSTEIAAKRRKKNSAARCERVAQAAERRETIGQRVSAGYRIDVCHSPGGAAN